MGVEGAVQELLNFDYKTLIMSIIIIAVALVAVKEFNDKFVKLFNIETPRMRKERERKEEIESINARLEEIQERQQELSQKSIDADTRIDKQITEIGNLLNSLTVASMRSTLWRIHTESTERGYITQEGLKTFTECGKLYEEAGGDDIYHEKLHPDVMALPIRVNDAKSKSK